MTVQEEIHGLGIKAADTDAGSSVADQGHDIYIELAFVVFAEGAEAAGVFGSKKPCSHYTGRGRICFHTKGREAAVAGDLGGNALADKGPRQMYLPAISRSCSPGWIALALTMRPHAAVWVFLPCWMWSRNCKNLGVTPVMTCPLLFCVPMCWK